ncbi:hypothetical protein V8F33_009983 [Rhypophila sp. PSN 637]
MHIPSALAVVAVFCQAVAADWTSPSLPFPNISAPVLTNNSTVAIRDDNTRTDRQIWGSGGGCQRFGQAIGILTKLKSGWITGPAVTLAVARPRTGAGRT